jgi:hypothetical protein
LQHGDERAAARSSRPRRPGWGRSKRPCASLTHSRPAEGACDDRRRARRACSARGTSSRPISTPRTRAAVVGVAASGAATAVRSPAPAVDAPSALGGVAGDCSASEGASARDSEVVRRRETRRTTRLPGTARRRRRVRS